MQPNGVAGQAGGIQASQHQLGLTAGTQGFYHQQYAQMAERINQDIDEDFNRRENEMRPPKIQSHMSESGAYGVNYPAAGELARKRQERLLKAHNIASSSPSNQLHRGEIDQIHKHPRDS